MKTIVLFVAKLILKVSLAVVIAALYVFNILFAVCAAILRYTLLPVMFVAAVIAVTTYSEHGMIRDVVECIGTFAVAGVAYFALPLLPQLIAWLMNFLAAAFYSIHIFEKSSVKYVFN